MPTREYLQKLVSLLRSVTTLADHRKARGHAGGKRGPKGIEAEELIGVAKITPRTVRSLTDEELYDLDDTFVILASKHGFGKKRKQVYSNAVSFIRIELVRRGLQIIDKEFNLDVGDVHVNQLMPEIFDDEVSMPFPNEHACRIASPGQFSRFRRNNSTSPNTIIGFKASGGSSLQAFRYPIGKWSAEAARAHCRTHSGSFEAASKETKAAEHIDYDIDDVNDYEIGRFIGKTAANYRETEQTDEICGNCIFFVKPNGCYLISPAGIEAEDTCDLWRPDKE